jgi:hypothetical protein
VVGGALVVGGAGGGGSSTVTVGVGVGVRCACITTGDGVLVSVGTARALDDAGTPVAGCSCGNCVEPGTESGCTASTTASPPSTTVTADASAIRAGPWAGDSASVPRLAASSAARDPGRRGRAPVCRSSSSTVTLSRRLRALRVIHDLHLFPPPPRSPAAA